MDKTNKQTKGYLFKIELLINDRSNGLALEKLLHLLNSAAIADYRILSGMEIGKLIDIAQQQPQTPIPDKLLQAKAGSVKENTAPANLSNARENDQEKMQEHFRSYIEKGTLLRLFIVKGKGVKFNIPCRVLGVDPETQNITVYHVDEKNVYLVKWNEIENIEIC